MLRPAYHRSAARIKAHVMLAVIAGNCVRRLETLTGTLIAELRKRFDRVRAHRIRSGAREYWVVNEMGRDDRAILKKLGIAALPDQWTRWREPAVTPTPPPILALPLTN